MLRKKLKFLQIVFRLNIILLMESFYVKAVWIERCWVFVCSAATKRMITGKEDILRCWLKKKRRRGGGRIRAFYFFLVFVSDLRFKFFFFIFSNPKAPLKPLALPFKSGKLLIEVYNANKILTMLHTEKAETFTLSFHSLFIYIDDNLLNLTKHFCPKILCRTNW